MRAQALVALAAAYSLLIAQEALAVLPPGPVSDPDGKQWRQISLASITMERGSLRVTGGNAYYEQAVVVWRAGRDAAMVHVGQANRGLRAKGRPGGDGGGRPQSLDLSAAGTYFFQCWHKVEDRAKHITEVGWKASYMRLTGDPQRGYALSCDDGGDHDFNDFTAEISVFE